ncbi:AAA family ATPase [Algoriphagus sp. oki45]|nr:AAA family ATPase [Algoriphagus sp. oki45]
MEILFEKFFKKIELVSLDFKRSLMSEIDWNSRLIGIKGARGVGKTTLLLQYIKQNLPLDGSTLYVSLDNVWFAENRLIDLVDSFAKRGGRNLFLDEVHKYPNWSQELKNIYDDFPEVKVVFTGSSLLEILNARADLSRRAIVYFMQGLSYREYIEMETGQVFPQFELEEIITNHLVLAHQINGKLQPLKYFMDYLQSGYFPFYKEGRTLYHQRIEEVINMTLEIELPLLRKIDVSYVTKLKQLMQILSESVPFVPNVSKLSERIGINRNTFVTYLYFLQEAHLTKNLYKDSKGITQLQKPDKIFLENTNFNFALAPKSTEVGAIRESFIVNQLSYKHLVEYGDQGDFIIDRKYTLEVGGKRKGKKQIESLPNAFVVSDDIEYGIGNKIPIWLFGFLY